MRDYVQLTKPRITLMVAVTAALGYSLAGGAFSWGMLWAVFGTTLTSAAACALNQWWETVPDARMRRTQSRPLPAGRVGLQNALLFGLGLGLAGLVVLYALANTLAAGLALASMAFYVLAYTPLKQITPHSTWVGAFSGAMPPVIGWAAAQGAVPPAAWALFAIQFLWQIPHFLALFWLYRSDYERAGFRVMPVIDPSGRTTALQIAIHSFALLLASVLPTLLGASSLRYGYGALILSTGFLIIGLKTAWTMAERDMRRLFRASLLYLPAILVMLAVWRV